jgi:hypothetical protein
VTVTHTGAGGGTSRVGKQNRSHHQVAAVDVEGRAGDVAGSLRGGEANQIGDFERSAEARHGIARGKTFEQLVRGMFARQLGIDGSTPACDTSTRARERA